MVPFDWVEVHLHVKAGWRSVLKAGGEQSVTLAGTVEMQQWCAGNWDTLLLVSGSAYALSQECRLYAPFFAGPVPYINAFYGQGSGPIWLDYLRCTGNETTLMNCSHSGIGITRYYCGHDDDVGVQCPGISLFKIYMLHIHAMIQLQMNLWIFAFKVFL